MSTNDTDARADLLASMFEMASIADAAPNDAQPDSFAQALRFCVDDPELVGEAEERADKHTESVTPSLMTDHHYIGESFEQVTARREDPNLSTTVIKEPYGLHYTVFDHFHVDIIGGHKQEPTVFIDSDEFSTNLVVRDTEGTFDVDIDLDASPSDVYDEYQNPALDAAQDHLPTDETSTHE